MTSYDVLMAGGDSGTVVVPGDAASSLIVKRIRGVIPPQMPRGGLPLSDDEITRIMTWVDEGALNN